MKQQIIRIRRRNGRLAKFDQERITTAIYQAVTAVSEEDGKLSQKLSNQVVKIISRRFKERVPTVEDVQDVVEEVLIRADLTEIAKAYIIYREQRRKLRETVKVTNESLGMVDQYLKEVDWEVKENANMTYSLQGLNNYISNGVTKRYWFEKVYPSEIRESAEGGDFHIHDLGILAPYTFFGKETVVIKLNGKIKLVSLENLYNNIIQKEDFLNKKDQVFAKYPRNLFILDKEGWTKVSRLVKKKKQREMRFIKSEQGRSVIVTDNHPFIVKNQKNGKQKEILASEVQEKEHLSLSCFLPSLLSSEKLFTKKEIYLAQELIDKDYQDFFLEGYKWQDFIENWGGSLKVKGTLSVSNKSNSLDNYFELSEDFGYLVGIFIAEGHYHSWRMEITLGEEKIIKKVQKICSNLGIRTYINKHEQTKRISINCSTLKLVFEKVFQIKPFSQNKTLPIDILNYNFDFIKGLIAGIIDGDGNVSTQGSQIIIRTASRTMLEQMAILLQFFGIICRDRAIEGVGSKRVYNGREIIQKFPLYGISFSKKEKLDLPSFKYQKANVAQKNWRVEEYGWNKVLNNKSTSIADDFIYDITTDSHTFLCNGLLVHNCVGWSLEDILRKGFTGVYGKISSKPAKHLRVALGQLVNFFYTLQGEAAGAIAVSSFDTFLAPFIRYDKLTYSQIKQAMQEFMFNCNVPTRVGFQCMSEDTEILTKDGWKNYRQVKKGSIIATFNIEKGFIEYLPVNNVFTKKYKGIMYNLKNRISDQLISPEHRVVRKMFNSESYTLEKIEKVLSLKSPFMVPVGSEGNVLGDDKLDENIVKLTAWLIEEGTIDKGRRGSGRISIYQSKEKNPENYEEINFLCHNLDLKYTERMQRGLGADCNVIRFNANSTRKILNYFNSNKNKGIKFIPDSILNSDVETSRLFLETYIKGDGHDGCKITTTEEKIKDGLLQVIVNAGYGATVLVRKPDNALSKKDRYIIRCIKHKDTYINQIKKVNYQGIIWCPNTKNETVVARRKGKVFITGNTPFTNITLDLNPPNNLAELPVIIGGKIQKEKYGDFQEEMDLFNKAFYEVIMEGDATQRVFTFPIPTINITKDFDWDNPSYKSIWESTAKYGINYFSNFINSELNPEDIRSMCCRLRINNKDLHHRGGGLFGSAPLTGCYDKETEILTESGWKFFKDLTKNEKVFTLAENNEIELHKPRKIFKYDYKGEMYQFKAKSLDLLVTPNHRMVIDQRYKDKRRFVEAKDLKPANHRIPKQGVWKRDEIEHFILPGIEFTKYGRQGITPYQVFREALKIEMDNWLEFFGFWLAEGCADNKNIAKRHGYRVIITQVNKKKNREIQKVLDCLPFNYYIERKINFVICNKQLWTYLRQFGNKYQKFIPKEIKNLGKRQLRILFNWMVKGDGHIRKTTGQINYWTSSEKLADDLQEVILKIGWLGTISARKRNISQIRGRKVKSGIVYTIGVQKSKHYRLRKNSIKKIYYKDKVYCCEVRNHTVFVRRNGKVSWCGNSIGVVTINLPRIGYLTKTKKEFFNKLENLMDLAKESLEIKRKTLEDFIEKDLYPYSKFYLSDIKKLRGQYWANHFSTIGLVGMNEALLNFLKKDMISDEGQKFAQEVLDFMNQRLLDYQKETKNIYNLEATPAEGTSYRLAKKDKEHYPQIITAGKDVPYYTNCVSDDTDILTKEGWKRYNDVKVRDEILTLNMDRKILEYQRILNIHTQYLDNKPMFNIKSQKQDQLITPNHMVVYDGDRKGKYSLATPRNLPWRIIIPMAGKINQYTKEIDDDIIRMIGWIITEGHFETDCNAIRITQAEWCNKNKFKEIGEILKKLKVKFKIHGDKRGRSIFRISASDGIKIRSKYISNKHIPRWCLNELDYRQLNILLETMMKGDGSISKHSKYFCSGDKQLIDEFQELCIKTCRRAVICDYREMTACYHAVPSDFHHTEINKNNIKEIKHTGIVWCPEVENHTFVARRNGKPFITGNSTQLPVDYNGDLFSALALQDNCQTKYTGGCIEKGNKVLTNKGLLNIEYIVKNFNKLKPIKVLGYNIKKGISEWDSVVDAVFVDVKKKNKIKIKAERGLDIITSDWHPFFVLERIKVNSICPVCQQKVENIKGFASHLGRNPKCREEYLLMFKYQVLEKRADELKKGDYILQNFDNLYPEKSTALNNDLMWLIGFFIGDGCISKFIDNRGGHNLEKYRVRFHSENQRALQKIVRIISEHFHTEVKVIKNDKRSKSLREVTISKKVVLDFFFKYGFNSGKKVYNISVPQKVRENFNKSNVFAFLSGLIDSDGHISKRDGDFEYQTVSDKLAEDILEISTRAGLMISKSLKASKRKNEVNIYRLRIPRYQMTRIKDKLNDSVNCSKIKTKLSDRKKRQLPVIRVTQISKVDMKDNQFYDLTTKKNHNYLAGKNTLVFIHNTVFHAFLGERIFNSESVKSLIKKVFVKFRLPYFTLTPTFSICPTHNYINGKHFTCPECGEKTEVYSRVVGYLRPIQQWNKGKQEEFKQRKVFDVENKKNLISSELQN